MKFPAIALISKRELRGTVAPIWKPASLLADAAMESLGVSLVWAVAAIPVRLCGVGVVVLGVEFAG